MNIEFYNEAKKGDVRYQYTLGNAYRKGKGVSEDLDEAIKWYKMAANQGHVDSQYALGDLYLTKKENDSEALKWYRKAADQDHIEALNNVAGMYKHGRGVSKDYKKAAEFLWKAVKLGDHWACYDLARFYEEGWGVSKDRGLAAELRAKSEILEYRWAIRRGLEIL